MVLYAKNCRTLVLKGIFPFGQLFDQAVPLSVNLLQAGFCVSNRKKTSIFFLGHQIVSISEFPWILQIPN